ncbi:MAG TPA: hypothetical protein VHY91_26355 [Pirellulales bacterium]|jgi:hypothetical protein|nr:hypothetical protein [Pirellulales bacterium]
MEWNDLYRAYLQFAPPVQNAPRRGRHGVWIPEFPEGIVHWCDARKDKKLHELQVELSQWAIESAPGLSMISDDERAKFVSQVKDEIENIKQTGKAVVKRQFRGDSFELIHEEEATFTREKYRNPPAAAK